jgi:L-iditol 2-dehydrogenase
MSAPGKMRVALTKAPGEAELVERDIPDLMPGDLLVKTAVVGVCAGDTAPWYVERKVPAVLGHEPAGTVAAVGGADTGFEVGDRVFFHHHAPCFTCDDCRASNFTLCPQWRSSHLDPGGLSEYVRVPAVNVKDTLKLPDSVSFEDAALVEPLACCVKAMNRVKLHPGESVAIIGLGAMGLLTAQLAKSQAAGCIVGTDLVPYRLERALTLGCDATVAADDPDCVEKAKAANGGRGFDVVYVGPGATAAQQAGLDLLAPGGRWCCFWPTPPEERLSISTHDLYFREQTLHFSYSCGPNDTREALSWIHRGAVRAAELVTHRFPFEQTADAFRITREAGHSVKAIVLVDESQV